MAIKLNAQKIMLLLWGLPDDRPLAVAAVRLVVPGMTDTGFRSLITFLERRGLLFKEKWLSEYRIGLTMQGSATLSALFPALLDRWSEWDGKWMLLVCKAAPDSDPSFRYLRSRVLQERALVVSRGVYAIPHSFSRALLEECIKMYMQSVAVFSVAAVQQGLDRPLVVSYYDLDQLAHAYSGISKEVGRLLLKISGNNVFTDQYKKAFSALFDQYVECLRGDVGILGHYFPGLPDGRTLISELRKVIAL